MSNRATLTSLVILAALLVALGFGLKHVAHKDAETYVRAFGVTSLRATKDGGCNVLNKGASRVMAKQGDKVTWLIVGGCKGHKIGIYNFRLIDPELRDPTTKD